MTGETKDIDRVFIRKEDREIYQTIRTQEGDLQGASNAELFLMAMMFGYDKNKKLNVNVMEKEPPKLNDGLIRTASFDTDAWDLIKSLAVHIDQDVDVLVDNNRMLDIAQRYAFEGISDLNKKYNEDKHGFLDYLEELIDKKFEEYEIGI